MPTNSGVDHLTSEYGNDSDDIPLIPLKKKITGIRTPYLVLMGDLKTPNQVWILPVSNRFGGEMILALSPGRPNAVFFHHPAYPLWIYL